MPTNSINQKQEFAFISSEFLSLSYLNDSGSWISIPGVMAADNSGSGSSSRDVISANGQVIKRIGRSRVSELTFDSHALPTDAAWRAMRKAQQDRDPIAIPARYRRGDRLGIRFDEWSDGSGRLRHGSGDLHRRSFGRSSDPDAR